MSQTRIEVHPRYWRIVAANGEVIAHSESYATQWNTKRAARRLAKITGLPLVES